MDQLKWKFSKLLLQRQLHNELQILKFHLEINNVNVRVQMISQMSLSTAMP